VRGRRGARAGGGGVRTGELGVVKQSAEAMGNVRVTLLYAFSEGGTALRHWRRGVRRDSEEEESEERAPPVPAHACALPATPGVSHWSAGLARCPMSNMGVTIREHRNFESNSCHSPIRQCTRAPVSRCSPLRRESDRGGRQRRGQRGPAHDAPDRDGARRLRPEGQHQGADGHQPSGHIGPRAAAAGALGPKGTVGDIDWLFGLHCCTGKCFCVERWTGGGRGPSTPRSRRGSAPGHQRRKQQDKGVGRDRVLILVP